MLRLDAQILRLMLHVISSILLLLVIQHSAPPKFLFCIFRLFTLSPASTNLTQRYGKVKEEKGYTTRIVCTTLSGCYARTHRLHQQPSLYLFALLLYIPYIILTPTGTFLSNKKFGNVFLQEGAFALDSILLFLSKKAKFASLRVYSSFLLSAFLDCSPLFRSSSELTFNTSPKP